MGEATTFGDEWLERETRGKREHEIALLPTGSQMVPITEPLCQMYSCRTQVSTLISEPLDLTQWELSPEPVPTGWLAKLMGLPLWSSKIRERMV